ncbi:MAG: LuxR C-terminal-related transcriptional regulator [Parafannyhessea sp.]|uniref:helix-turn-helix transcriptional regulator n=1 Tax=Parafannyhessea sp. TaxID=2847324 RepID=UPI003EFE2345
MYVALFYYSLFILLACGMTAAICLSAYFVTRRRADLCLVACYLIYFLDAAIVYQDDFVTGGGAYHNASFFYIGHPLLSAVTGAGAFGCLWLYVCERLEVRSRAMRFVPIALLLVFPPVLYRLIPGARLAEFAFFFSREVFMGFVLAYVGYRFATASDAARMRMGRKRREYWAIVLLTCLTALENVVFILLFDPSRLDAGFLWFFAERNISENLLFLAMAVIALRQASQTLRLRFDQPPTRESENVQQSIDAVLPRFCERYGLSARESEVLRLLVLGKDNQNIASEMGIAASTVKVHVHNVLKKCGQPNRQELTKAFWAR